MAIGVGTLVWVVVFALRRLTARRDRLLLVAMTAFAAAAVVVGLQLFDLILS